MLNQHVKIFEIDKTLSINNGNILVKTVILAAKEVTSIHIKHKTGRPVSLLHVKKRLFSQMKSEEY